MRPFRSFLLLLIFLACFTGLYYIVPGKLRLPGINDFIPANIIKKVHEKGTLFPRQNTSFAKTVIPLPVNSNKVSESVTIITSCQTSISFEAAIDSLESSKGQVRIMYYGDSQIEGDRITSYLRQSLRKGRGGTGPGLFLPLMPVMYSKSIFIRSSSSWRRYNYLSYKNSEIENKNLGPFMTLCRYLPPCSRSEEPVKAYVRIVPSEFADSAAAVFDNLRLFYRNTQGIVNLKVSNGDNQIFQDTLSTGEGIRERVINLNKSKDVRLELEGYFSPDIYGISIESGKGVIVDNIPQRGSAGLEFTMVGKENLKKIYEKLRPDLFILHYGLNIVKNIRENYSYYENGLYRQILLLKEICPKTPILVISLTDMAFTDGDSIKSYPNIAIIKDAQKKAAARAGAAFWDSYEAMGGKYSVVKWAEKKLPLIQKDYVHFTYPGADTISKMLFHAMFTPIRNNTVASLNNISGADSIKNGKTAAALVPENPEQKEIFIKGMISDILGYNPGKPFVFTSPAFWIFFLFVLAGYSLFYRKLALRNVYLFLISLFFYFKTGGLFLFLLIFVTVVDFSCGLLIYGAGKKLTRKFYLLLSLISNLGLLGYFKYAGFIIESVNKLFGTDLKVYDMLSAFSNSSLGTSFDISYIMLPVGISFFTFQSLSYTIDVYRRKMKPVRNIIDFGFYVSFFPHLVAGPIVRASCLCHRSIRNST